MGESPPARLLQPGGEAAPPRLWLDDRCAPGPPRPDASARPGAAGRIRNVLVARAPRAAVSCHPRGSAPG
jgi:hypothetical protein